MKKNYTAFYLCLALLILPDQYSTAPVNIRRRPNRRNGEEGELFEGDIILSTAEKREILESNMHILQERMAMQDGPDGSGQQLGSILTDDTRWTNGLVPFKFDGNLDSDLLMVYTEAMARWTAATCVDFVMAEESDVDYLNLAGDGCASAIGRKGGPQDVKIGVSGCKKEGNAVHELGHALGLWHEHTRTDRDKYVQVLLENIDDNFEHNFKEHEHPFVPDLNYDIESIMHYGSSAFSLDADVLKTILIKQEVPECMDPDIMGQREKLSFKDKLRVNMMYNCTAEVEDMLKNIEPCLYTELPPDITPEPPTTPPTKECKETKNIESGTKVRMQFYQESQKPDPNTVYCQSSCKKRTNCIVDPSSSCKEEEFEIHLVEDRKNTKIKVGDLVAFKSLYRKLERMDCSRDFCELSYCPGNIICLQHQLEIHRENQRTSLRIQTKDKVYFKSPGEDKYLNCAGTQCRLVAECEGSAQGSSSGESGLSCGKRQLFSITKEPECTESQ